MSVDNKVTAAKQPATTTPTFSPRERGYINLNADVGSQVVTKMSGVTIDSVALRVGSEQCRSPNRKTRSSGVVLCNHGVAHASQPKQRWLVVETENRLAYAPFALDDWLPMMACLRWQLRERRSTTNFLDD
jgi:hypothetical protein